MKGLKNRITKEPLWYSWVVGGLLLLWGEIGLNTNIISKAYAPYIIITSVILIMAQPIYKPYSKSE